MGDLWVMSPVALSKEPRRPSNSFSSNSSLAFTKPLSQAEMSCHSPLRRAFGAVLSRLLTNSVDIVLSSFLYEPRHGFCCNVCRLGEMVHTDNCSDLGQTRGWAVPKPPHTLQELLAARAREDIPSSDFGAEAIVRTHDQVRGNRSFRACPLATRHGSGVAGTRAAVMGEKGRDVICQPRVGFGIRRDRWCRHGARCHVSCGP